MRKWVASFCALLLSACAHHPEVVGRSGLAGAGPTGESAPCADCARQGEMKLVMVDSSTLLEIAPGFSLHALTDTVGVAGFLKVEANPGKSCKFCHAFSEDVVEFDYGSAQDSMLTAIAPNLRLAVLVSGLQVPERDSLSLDSITQILSQTTWINGALMSDFSPWASKRGLVRESVREAPTAAREALARLALRWHTRFVVLPLHINVDIDSKAGSEGGYQLQVLWTLWDAKQGTLLVLAYAHMALETHGDVPPDRLWTRPFIEWLGKKLI